MKAIDIIKKAFASAGDDFFEMTTTLTENELEKEIEINTHDFVAWSSKHIYVFVVVSVYRIWIKLYPINSEFFEMVVPIDLEKEAKNE